MAKTSGHILKYARPGWKSQLCDAATNTASWNLTGERPRQSCYRFGFRRDRELPQRFAALGWLELMGWMPTSPSVVGCRLRRYDAACRRRRPWQPELMGWMPPSSGIIWWPSRHSGAVEGGDHVRRAYSGNRPREAELSGLWHRSGWGRCGCSRLCKVVLPTSSAAWRFYRSCVRPLVVACATSRYAVLRTGSTSVERALCSSPGTGLPPPEH